MKWITAHKWEVEMTNGDMEAIEAVIGTAVIFAMIVAMMFL